MPGPGRFAIRFAINITRYHLKGVFFGESMDHLPINKYSIIVYNVHQDYTQNGVLYTSWAAKVGAIHIRNVKTHIEERTTA